MKIRPLGGALCLAVLAFACSGGLNGVVRSPNPVTASSEVTPDRGSLVFSDDFNDPKSGWSTDNVADFKASFNKSGYVIVVTGFVDHEVSAPYLTPKDQLSVSVTATESSTSPVGSGFGAGCDRGLTEPTISYDFHVAVGGTWGIFRHDLRRAAGSQHSLLKQGTSPKAPGPILRTVVLICATLSDAVTTRLVMFVEGTQVADIADPVSDLPRLGWVGGLVVTGEDSGPTTVTVTHFEERDLRF